MLPPFRIRCCNIDYRRGDVEVTAAIHEGLVNLEVWGFAPHWSTAGTEDSGDSLPEEAYDGNVEIELTPDQARRLARAIVAAADASEAASSVRNGAR